MPVAVRIELDEKRLRAIERELAAAPGAMPKVMSRAVNKVATAARTEIVRGVAQETALTQKDARKSVGLTRATYRRWAATIRVGGRRIPLIRFKARQTRKGVTYQVPGGGGGRSAAAGAFIATMPGGRRGVFRRQGAPRLPIYELFGPSLQGVVEGVDRLAWRTLRRTLDRRLGQEIDRQVGVVLDRRRRRTAG